MDRILQFKDVSYESVTERFASLRSISFNVCASDIILILVKGLRDRIPICDLAEGLELPDKGSVIFLGEDWRKMTIFGCSMMRGKIGRVFFNPGWVSNLDVYENITLSMRHHSAMTETEIQSNVKKTAKYFGFDSIPECRPEMLKKDELKRFEWVRAFAGDPSLVLLDHPELSVKKENITCLIDFVTKSDFFSKSAMIWITSDYRVWEENRFKIKNVKRYIVQDEMVVHLEAD